MWRKRSVTPGDTSPRDALIGNRRHTDPVRERPSVRGHNSETDGSCKTDDALDAEKATKRSVTKVRTTSLTTDHKPDNATEKKRIEEAGGLVIYSKMDGVPRLNGKIAVSRSLGDLHDPNVDGYISQEPDFNVVDLAEYSKSVRPHSLVVKISFMS